jgi:hypothetical protein
VNDISPKSGSLGGGYILTITGSNFSPNRGSTQVFVGDGMDSQCNIVSLTTTQIQCIVPIMSYDEKAGDPQTVVVTGRLTE